MEEGASAEQSGAGRPGRGRLRAVLLAAVVLLYALSVPWYRDPQEPPALWLGVPDWVVVALGCYAAAAVLNSIAWLLTDLRDEPDRDGEP